ncbi:GNAT family N-acetyltransferase [Hyphobacterium sp. CCMP332]|uniref:GNAT family N-acetyltransferase n=1 Tax=Hyphobacterium sp. CCMP332 TaxID=2749086 RepID=UPI00164F0AF3|nr:GNAT family N-acetyltransferase [Hyphobacterium sp. CCMP332]QNL19975.1 GNAT family N-acetyltransferase [Hyphobacterium sp. CCMP332]
MSSAVLYRWKLTPGTEDTFRKAWTEATRAIHKTCASYGARLHEGADGLFWSYARWPSEELRQKCWENEGLGDLPCFGTMRDCIEERFPEVVLTLTADELSEREAGHPVPVYETERLVLRGIRQDDAEALFPAVSDEANMRYWSRGPMQTVAEVYDYLAWNAHGDGCQCWAVERKTEPGKAVGWVILMDKDNNQAEIGFMFRSDAQGQGIAFEAASKMLEHALTVRRFQRVWADVDPDNQASIKLIERLGLSYEGRLKGNWSTHIGVRDSLIYAIVVPENGPKVPL